MKTPTPAHVVATAVAVLLSLLWFAAPRGVAWAQSQPGAAPTAATDPDAPLFQRMCTECHDALRVTQTRHTKTEWVDILNKMIGEGATGTDQEFETVAAYLLRYYGKVLVNRATAEDLVKIVGLSQHDADAIVR